MGGDAGTFAETIIPDEGALTGYGSSYSPANPNTAYSVDGMAVSLDTFIHRGGLLLHDRFALLEDAARSSVPTLLNYEVSSIDGRLVRDFGLNEQKAIAETLESEGTLIRNWLVNDSWFATLAYSHNFLVGTASEADPQSTIRNVDPILNKIRYLGDNVNNPDLKSMLQVRLMQLLSKGCADAFRRAGLSTPEELINMGITIASSPLLNDSNNNDTLGISEAIRRIAVQSQAPAQTIRSQFTSRGPIIFFRAEAFADKTYLDEAVAHEFIHAAGIDKFPLWGYALGRGTDLSGYEHYRDIIDNCGYQNVR